MKLLKIVQFNNLTPEQIKKFEVRHASRAVVFDEDKNVGLLFVSRHDYHKLPGGGIEEGEDMEAALKRECREEIGCAIKIGAELGEVIEYRDRWETEQHSYCYAAEITGAKGDPDFTQSELDVGFQIKWVPLAEAIKLIADDKSDDYQAGFTKIRDGAILQAAVELLNDNPRI